LSFVQAASVNLHSATALVGAAMANRLPVISLPADLGSNPANLANLFSPPTLFYALADNVAQTAFDDFTLYHRQETAEAALVQADAQYPGTVITAFQNVADSLRALQADARAIDYGQAAAAPAGHLFRIAERGAYLSAIFSGARAGASQSLH
jgi:outer membrane protein TolC